MAFDYKKILPHLLVIIGFIIASLVYFKPVLNGKVLHQSDHKQYEGMARQLKDFKKNHHERTYWVDNAFGGMPTYIISKANFPDSFVKTLNKSINFLPNPVNYLFLYFLGLYILFLVLKIDYKLAALGSLAFGFSTYLIIILSVGHLTKAHAIAFMPLVLAGVFSMLSKKHLWGGILLTLGLSLELYTGHFQIIYYLLYMVIILMVIYAYKGIKNHQTPEFIKTVGFMLIAVLIAVGANATNFMATQQYTQWSTRGNTGLTIIPDGGDKPKEGLSYDYITAYSYGLAETMNLFIPRFTGGASTESLERDSHVYKILLKKGASPIQADQIAENMPTYWGDQPYVAAPNYIGASVIFLFILGLYLVKGSLKWWVVASTVLALMLALGKHFELLTRFFINYVPLYSKFRTVSMIQVIPELLIPFFGIYGLSKLFSKKLDQTTKLHALKWTTLITVGVCVFFLLFKSWLFDFSGMQDRRLMQNIGPDFIDALKQDRIAMFNKDTLRSLIFVGLAALTLFAFLKGKLKKNYCIVIFAVLILVDMVGIDRDYVNDNDFTTRSLANKFKPNSADKKIMKDKGYYRVLDLTENPMNTARASAFHNAVGGYSAAKPGRFQELYDFYIGQGKRSVINMLNTKYFIVDHNGEPMAQQNEAAFGHVWFIDSVQFVKSANREMKVLGQINPKTTAVVDQKFKDLIPKKYFTDHHDDEIHLEHHQPNKSVYHYNLKEDRLAVFSEMYYPHGWRATIDSKPVDIARVDYVLRALYLKKGEHKVVFEFKPNVVSIGHIVSVASSILLGLIILGGLIYEIKRGTFRK